MRIVRRAWTLDKHDQRKKQRLKWFDSKDGKNLRLHVCSQIFLQGERRRCALCNINSNHKKEGSEVVLQYVQYILEHFFWNENNELFGGLTLSVRPLSKNQ